MAKEKTRRKFFGIDVLGHLEAEGTGVKYLFMPRMTLQYPEVCQDFGPNYRGMLKFYPDRCISCTLCARICPSNAIKMYKVDAKKQPGITYQRCIFCGFCVDICPVDALEMSNVHDVAYYGLTEQVQKPEEFSKGPPVMEKAKKVKPQLDEKRGIRYEPV
jgi:NADH-quinone oxidoreductase subunit I